jgi:hypothetical protein
MNAETRRWVDLLLTGWEQDRKDTLHDANPAESAALRFIIDAAREALYAETPVCIFCEEVPAECACDQPEVPA